MTVKMTRYRQQQALRQKLIRMRVSAVRRYVMERIRDLEATTL